MLKRPSVLPGFGLSMGCTLLYVSLLVAIPLAALALRAASMSFPEFWAAATSGRVVASYRLILETAFTASVANAAFGTLVAWVLTRYSFPGRRLMDALIDLPFALPTAVAGITLTELFDKSGWIGRYFHAVGIPVAFTPLGIAVALTFIGLPFVVRTLQPVIQDLDREAEDAAAMLGASRWQTFWQVIFPTLKPALMSGFTQAFARSLGEYGSVVFISGNIKGSTEIPAYLIVTKLEEWDYAGATVIALVMLALSLALLASINVMQGRAGVKAGMAHG